MGVRNFKETTVYKKAFSLAMENSETFVWIDFAFECEYINELAKANLLFKNEEVGRLLHHMINNPEKY